MNSRPEVGPESGERYFYPSLARTATGNFIPAQSLMMDEYCAECHADAHETWSHSVHRFASFNNPAYLFSVRNTRQFALERDGSVQAARFCAGCHDLVPFFSGAFDDPNFDHNQPQNRFLYYFLHRQSNGENIKRNPLNFCFPLPYQG